MCCGVLQCVAVCCSVLQCVAIWISHVVRIAHHLQKKERELGREGVFFFFGKHMCALVCVVHHLHREARRDCVCERERDRHRHTLSHTHVCVCVDVCVSVSYIIFICRRGEREHV